MSSGGRWIGLDVGAKRTGLAVTDAMQIIASPVEGCQTAELVQRLSELVSEEPCAGLVVGEARQTNNEPSEAQIVIDKVMKGIKQAFPELEVHKVDERFTSVMAARALVEAGVPKKKRQQKLRVDSTSAAIILQSFLDQKRKI